METLSIECLKCGQTRRLERSLGLDANDCPRCGYLGWAPSASLNESVRRALRERPPERRRISLRVAA